MRYKQKKHRTVEQPKSTVAVFSPTELVHLVRVKMAIGDKVIKQRVLLSGVPAPQIERILRSFLVTERFDSIEITEVESVSEKCRVLSTNTENVIQTTEPIIERDERTEIVPQQKMSTEKMSVKLYAVGVATTMPAVDERSAIRKTGYALIASASDGSTHFGARLSDGSTVTTEQIPMSSGFAMPRDVSNESNRAHIFKS